MGEVGEVDETHVQGTEVSFFLANSCKRRMYDEHNIVSTARGGGLQTKTTVPPAEHLSVRSCLVTMAARDDL